MSQALQEKQSGTADGLRDLLRNFYGRQITKTADLETNACCDVNTMLEHQAVVQLIPTAAKERYYGCGSPIPDDRENLQGLTAVDLGSGAGVDSMILRYYLGQGGQMIGLDMTPEQLDVARTAGMEFSRRLAFAPDSLQFREDFIETADSIPDASVDLVISNCVINLSPRKDLVFQTIQRILKPGGEFFISDIVSDRRTDLADDEVLVAECLGLAPYINDARDLMEEAGFRDVRIYSGRNLPENERVRRRGEAARFHSVIWRGYKLTALDRRCEDYGQSATYRGGLENAPVAFRLDEGHLFEKDRPMAVCRNTARMLSETRLSTYFNVTPAIKHFGLFADCGTQESAEGDSGFACC